MPARCVRVTGVMPREVARQVGDALWEPPATGGKTD